MNWRLAEAKNKLSELINLTLTEGPQRIMRRDDTVIVITEAEYSKLTGKDLTFKEFLMNGPTMDGVDLTRDSSPMRDVEL